ncbi:TolC family protein, partial [bacterium]|nr:TolC family protein [bacterium]
MKLKNKTIAFLVAVIMVSNFAPLTACAIQEKKMTRAEKKQMRLQEARKESALEIINFSWWEDFGDEYLNSYVLRAIEHNKDLKIATLRVEEARQAMKMQFASELPSLSVGASPAVLKLPGERNSVGSFAVPVIASYELDLFLKNRDKTKSAKKVWEASKFQEKSAYISIVSAVGTCYYNIVRLDKLIALQEEIIKDRKTIYELMSLRNKHGITSTADVVRAEKAYVFATSDMFELKKAREIALNALAVLVGDSPNNIAEYKRIAYDDIKNTKSIPESISSEVITSRPDYMVAEKMVDKSRLDVRVAKKEFLPTVDILGMLSFASTSISNMGSMNWTNAIAGAGGMINLPLFT